MWCLYVGDYKLNSQWTVMHDSCTINANNTITEIPHIECNCSNVHNDYSSIGIRYNHQKVISNLHNLGLLVPVWQSDPVKLEVHLQENWPRLLVQEPPFKHGADSHASISISHRTPVKPAKHTQRKDPFVFEQSPFSHGEAWHSSMSDSQRSPVKPTGQTQTEQSADCIWQFSEQATIHERRNLMYMHVYVSMNIYMCIDACTVHICMQFLAYFDSQFRWSCWCIGTRMSHRVPD